MAAVATSGPGYAAMAPLSAASGSSGSRGSQPGRAASRNALLHSQRAADGGRVNEEVDGEALFQLQHSLALILSQPGSGSTLEVLSKLLGNLVTCPHEAKFRQVRLSNRKIQEAIVQVGRLSCCC